MLDAELHRVLRHCQAALEEVNILYPKRYGFAPPQTAEGECKHQRYVVAGFSSEPVNIFSGQVDVSSRGLMRKVVDTSCRVYH